MKISQDCQSRELTALWHKNGEHITGEIHYLRKVSKKMLQSEASEQKLIPLQPRQAMSQRHAALVTLCHKQPCWHHSQLLVADFTLLSNRQLEKLSFSVLPLSPGASANHNSAHFWIWIHSVSTVQKDLYWEPNCLQKSGKLRPVKHCFY